MGRSFPAIPDHLVSWMEEQPVFFVASAPLGVDGHVNVSPKGGDSFRVTGPNSVAYLDFTGSGAETIAHTRENGRLTVMFTSFGAKPNIVRLFGRGRPVLPGDDGFDELAGRFPPNPGTRSVVTLDVAEVTTSCGYSIPRMELIGPRSTLDDWAERKGPDGLADYRRQKNQTSIDGLPALAD
ncbi:MAG: hypothetical protein JWO77_2710 [Ilumatobacteraceae bacterium]|nr:hypothetical protein [Ilumatobacteraceae bacterium]